MLDNIFSLIKSKQHIYELIAIKSYGVTDDGAKRIVEGELENYMTRLENYFADPKNKDATITQAQGANIFLEVMQSGLSFSQIANHVYISRMKGSGTAVAYKVTVDGEIYQVQRSGAISHLSEPVVVYNGEFFEIRQTHDGKQIANHTIILAGRPKFDINMLQAGYVYIVYPTGDRELSWISGERIKELRLKSPNQSMYNDESFIQTKIIRHALRKVRKTPFLNTSTYDEEAREFEPLTPPSPVPEYQPTMIINPVNNQNKEPF